MSLDEMVAGTSTNVGGLPGKVLSGILGDFEAQGYHLSPTEVSVLSALTAGYGTNAPLLMEKQEILLHVGWPENKGSKYDPVQRYTSKLRILIEQAGLQRKYRLHTVDMGVQDGTGYMLLVGTPKGRRKVAALRKVPLHQAENVRALHQAAVLNKLELSPDEARILYGLFRFGTLRQISAANIARIVLGDSSKKKHVNNRLGDIRKELHGRNINGFGYEIRHAGGANYQLRIAAFESQRWQDDFGGLIHKGIRLSPLEEKLLGAVVSAFPVALPLEDICSKIWGSVVPPQASPYHIVRGINAKLAASQFAGVYRVKVRQGIGFSLEARNQKTFEEYRRLKLAPLDSLKDYRAIRAMLEMNGIRLHMRAARALVPLLERIPFGAAPYETLAMAVWGDNYQRRAGLEVVMDQLRKALDGKKINGFGYHIQRHTSGYSIFKQKII